MVLTQGNHLEVLSGKEPHSEEREEIHSESEETHSEENETSEEHAKETP